MYVYIYYTFISSYCGSSLRKTQFAVKFYLLLVFLMIFHDFRKLGENQLGCDCELYVTLNETYKAVQSGICSTPIPAASAEVHFVKSDSQGLYFLDEDVNKYFLCGECVVFSSRSHTRLTID